VAGSCVHGNEPSGSVKRVRFLQELRNNQFLLSDLLHGVSDGMAGVTEF
jgi:hypothetical protein